MALLSLALVAAQPSAADVERNYERWERRLRSKVAELHILPAGGDTAELGDVVVSFSIDRDGRPTDARVQSSSGNTAYDNAARRLVRQLGRIGPAPSMGDQSHRVVLKLSYGFARNADLDRQLASALDTERHAYSRRNVQIVTTATVQTKSASR